ncbi:hypothetical protein DFH28DRAFT_88532 [Melampsora americana]|nr:hypothetical protein DFH28DRAFT_88532 [Melampsora americana]
MYDPTPNFLPPIHIREKTHLNPILPRSPRHVSSSYVNSPLSTTMTLSPDNHQYSNQPAVHRGPNQFVSPLNDQQRSQFVLPPIHSPLYPTYRYPSSSSEHLPTSSIHMDHSIPSSTLTQSNPNLTPSPSTLSSFPTRSGLGKIEGVHHPSDRVLVEQCLNVKCEPSDQFTNQENLKSNWKVFHHHHHHHQQQQDENLRSSSLGF